METQAISALAGALLTTPGIDAVAAWLASAPSANARVSMTPADSAAGDYLAVASTANRFDSATAATAASFTGMIDSGLAQVNRQLIAGQTALQQLALGQAPSLHGVMLALEESRLTFQLFMQVRNRLLESYHEIMRMQL